MREDSFEAVVQLYTEKSKLYIWMINNKLEDNDGEWVTVQPRNEWK